MRWRLQQSVWQQTAFVRARVVSEEIVCCAPNKRYNNCASGSTLVRSFLCLHRLRIPLLDSKITKSLWFLIVCSRRICDERLRQRSKAIDVCCAATICTLFYLNALSKFYDLAISVRNMNLPHIHYVYNEVTALKLCVWNYIITVFQIVCKMAHQFWRYFAKVFENDEM